MESATRGPAEAHDRRDKLRTMEEVRGWAWRRCAGVVVLLGLSSWPIACGDDAAGSGGAAGDASVDTSNDTSSGGGGGTGGSAGATMDGAADAAMDGVVDAGDGDGPIEAQDAAYTIELGAQVDTLLTSQHPGNAAVTYAMTSSPSLGEILHFDAATGRFVYTSTILGEDSFDFSILKNGQAVDSAKIALTTVPLDFVGDWHLDPSPATCAEYDFKVAKTDGGTWSISPLVSKCLKDAAGVNIYSGNKVTWNEGPQSLGVVSCVDDIQGVNTCYAFRFWRISSRSDFQSIETVSGSMTIGGQQYGVSGSVRGVVRRIGDTTNRAALTAMNTPIIQLGIANGATKVQSVTLENKGELPAKVGELALPPQVTMEGGYPGSGGTCGTTVDPGKTCSIVLTVTPTPPATGDQESVPLSLYFSDDVGYDVTRLSVSWTWQTPADN
jgi:hypothetical protein